MNNISDLKVVGKIFGSSGSIILQYWIRVLFRSSPVNITINVPLFKKVEAPSKCPEKWLTKKNYVPKILKQRDIGNFMYLSAVVYCCCVLLSVVGCSCVLLYVVGC